METRVPIASSNGKIKWTFSIVVVDSGAVFSADEATDVISVKQQPLMTIVNSITDCEFNHKSSPPTVALTSPLIALTDVSPSTVTNSPSFLYFLQWEVNQR